MKRSRFLIAAILLVSLGALPSFAGAAKRGWTKVQLTHADGSSGAFPPGLLGKVGGELLVDYGSQAVGYVPTGAVRALEAEARRSGIAVAQRDDFDMMHLPSAARVDAREGIGHEVPQDERVRNYPPNKPGLFVLQFVAPPRNEWVAELASLGWTLERYIPANAYVATGRPELVGRTKQLPFVQFVDFFHPYQKMKHVVRDGVSRELVFELASREHASEGIEAIRAVAENGVELWPGSSDTLVLARLAPALAEALLHHPLVISVSPRPFGRLSDERQVMSLTSNLNTAGSGPTSPKGYATWLNTRCTACATMAAADWKVGVADTGVDNGVNSGGHVDLAGRKYFGQRIYTSTHDTCSLGNLDCDTYGHGTIVAGIVAGNATSGRSDASGFYWSTGVAPGAGIFSTKVLTRAPGTTIDFTRLFEMTADAATNGVTIQNHSFNEYDELSEQSGLYSPNARQYDIAVRDADGSLSNNRTPLLIAVSAGNNNQPTGPHTARVLGGATAKNVLAMGGAESYRPDIENGQCAAEGDDFRNILAISRTRTRLPGYVKPDLVAPAGPIVSTNSVELDYDSQYCMDNLADFVVPGGEYDFQYNGGVGTSFAAPVGAGAALIVKRYLGATPAATSPALAKAMLIAGAKSIRGGINTATHPDSTIGAFPNGDQGFGRISFDDIITGSTPPVWYDQSTVRTFESGTQPFRVRLRVRDASKPVKAALVWSDAPGTAGTQTSSPPLVNDLDLELYRSSNTSQRYVGNYLQVVDTNKGEESKPVTLFAGEEGRDRANNVEVIRAFLNTNEELDVQVKPVSIGGDTNGSATTHEQDFALVVLNADAVNGGNVVAPVFTASRDVTTPTLVHLSWTASTNIMNPRYEIWRGTKLSNMAQLGSATTNLTYDDTAPADSTYIYKVVAVGNGSVSAASNIDIATTIAWTDNSISATSTAIRALHWNDLRRGVDYVRAAANLSIGSWALPIAGNGFIRASQLTELRTKLAEAFSTLGLPAPTFTTATPTANVSYIRPQDVLDLRSIIMN